MDNISFKDIVKKIKFIYIKIVDVFLCKNQVKDNTVKNKFKDYFYKNKRKIYISIFILIFLFFIEPLIQDYFTNKDDFKTLGTFFVTISAGLVSITAIISTFIIFSMQSNLEKLPFGLFQKFSSDSKLKTYLVTTLVLSILIGMLSLIHNIKLSGLLFVIFMISIVLIFIFLNLSFKRGLVLINPLEQLKILEEDIKQNLNFQESINYIDSLLKRNFRITEYEITSNILESLLSLNKIYLEKKDNNFLPFIEEINESWNDPIVNTTLDRLRINIAFLLKDKDEIAINQVLYCYMQLIKIYASIRDKNNKPLTIYSVIATQHLINDIEKILALKNQDLILNCIEKLEQISVSYISKGLFSESLKIINTLGKIGEVICKDKEHIILIEKVMDYFSKITKSLLLSNHKITYILEDLNKEISSVSKLIIMSPFISNFNYYLGNYYSYNNNSLIDFLYYIVDKISKKETLELNDKKELDNILVFIDKSRQINRDLIEIFCINNSFNNILYFIKKLSYISQYLSTLNYRKKDFLNQSEYNFLVITFIPEKMEIIKYISSYKMEESIFDLGIRYIENELLSGMPVIINQLLAWSFKDGKFNNYGQYKMVLGLIGAVYLNVNLTNEYKKKDFISYIKKLNSKYEITPETLKYVTDKLDEIILDGIKNSCPNNIEEYLINSKNIESINELLVEIKEVLG